MLYFCAKFQHEILSGGLEKARKQHMDGYNPMAIGVRLVELEED